MGAGAPLEDAGGVVVTGLLVPVEGACMLGWVLGCVACVEGCVAGLVAGCVAGLVVVVLPELPEFPELPLLPEFPEELLPELPPVEVPVVHSCAVKLPLNLSIALAPIEE